MNMRERLARAIYQARNGHGAKPWAHQPKAHQEPYLTDADAVLDELMTPTEGMEDDADEHVHDELKKQRAFSMEKYGTPAFASAPFSRRVFTAMIKAAKEGK